jgi:hypothetical protein
MDKAMYEYNIGNYSKASEYYSDVLILIDDRIAKSLNDTHSSAYKLFIAYGQKYLASSLFRLALVGEVSWKDSIAAFEKLISLRALNNDEYDMFLMSKQNAKLSTGENEFKIIKTKSYILRFVIPQKYQRPSLAHFGHAMIDGCVIIHSNYLYLYGLFFSTLHVWHLLAIHVGFFPFPH